MPITIKTGALKYKKSDGTYNGFNAIAQESTDQQLADIHAAGTAEVGAVMAKGEEVLESIPEDYTELEGEVSDLKSAIQEEIGQTVTDTPTITYTDGKTIQTNSPKGDIIDSPSYSISQELDVSSAQQFIVYYTDSNPYGSLAFYDASDNWIAASTQNDFITISTSQTPMDVPAGADHAIFSCMTSRKNVTFQTISTEQGAIYDAIDTKLDKNQGAANAGKTLAIDDSGNIVPAAVEKTKSVYMVDAPRKPLLPEMSADFAWCSMLQPEELKSKNVVITVSGTANNDELTASAISPDTLNVSDIGTDWVGGVLSADGVTFKVVNFKYISGSTIKIFPALTENITDGTLSNFMYDSGVNNGTRYVGMHLTQNGYKAFSQYLYAANPKHSEVSKYVSAFKPDLSTTTTSPFTWYGSNRINSDTYRFVNENRNLRWLNAPSQRQCIYRFSSSYTAHTTKSGVYWDVDLKGQSGYLEAYIYPIANIISLPSGMEIHVEVTIDGVKVYDQSYGDTVCKRVLVDYENANTGRIEIYSNKWDAVNGSHYGFGIGRVTWWVNDLEYPDTTLFPKGAVIAQMYDSWGVFHDGASGVELNRLHNAATGVTVPFTNNSKGDQTSAWGKAWFYDKVKQYNPAICVHDFGINDTNSEGSADIPSTIEGPDGVEYDNKLTSSEYANNMILLGKLATANKIQPIFTRNTLSTYYTFCYAMIDAMSSELA